MTILFLPASLISPTYSCIELPEIEPSELSKLKKLQQYYKKHWITKITPEELSINELNISTNNAAESYHSKLKSIIRTCHPRIWTFMSALNNVIQDTDNDIGRLRLGKDISRARKKAHLRNDDLRRTYKEKLRSGLLDPLEFIHKISHTIGKIHDRVSLQEDISNESEGEDVEIAVCCLFSTTRDNLDFHAM